MIVRESTTTIDTDTCYAVSYTHLEETNERIENIRSNQAVMGCLLYTSTVNTAEKGTFAAIPIF